jgi:Na+-driven multidrug efflux pump
MDSLRWPKCGHTTAGSASGRVGNLLGAGEPRRARTTAHVALAIVGALASLGALALYVWRREWALAFSPDDLDAAELLASCMPLVCETRTHA